MESALFFDPLGLSKVFVCNCLNIALKAQNLLFFALTYDVFLKRRSPCNFSNEFLDTLYKDSLTSPEVFHNYRELRRLCKLLLLDKQVNLRWGCLAVLLLSAITQPFPFLANRVSDWKRRKVTKLLAKFLDFGSVLVCSLDNLELGYLRSFEECNQCHDVCCYTNKQVKEERKLWRSSLQLRPQLQQLPLCFFLLERLWPQWKSSETFWRFFPHPEALRINQICSLSDYKFCLSPTWILPVFGLGLYNTHGFYSEPRCHSGGKSNRLSCEGQESQQETWMRRSSWVFHVSQEVKEQWTKISDWQRKGHRLALDMVGDTHAWGMFQK